MILNNPSSSSIPAPTGYSGAGNSCVHSLLAQAAPGTCGAQLRSVVEQIEPDEVKQMVGNVFEDLLRLLECLGLIVSHLRQVDAAEESFELFHLIHDEASQLVNYIRSDALSCPKLTEELADTLDGITFVINHDLQRIFGTPHTGTAGRATHIILSEVHRAHDVLTNCLQQSTISLAMVFDRTLVGSKLFNNSDVRQKQSLQLCQDLLNLHQLVIAFEAQPDAPQKKELMVGIAKFRQESMEYLMYSDWPQFESFCERIGIPTDDPAALMLVLHQFQCYLETLLGQVRMRAVLVEQSAPSEFENPFGSSVSESSSADSNHPEFALSL